jgi:THO complex subunit 1
MDVQDPVAAACRADRTRLLEVFRLAISKPLPASQTAVATMVEAAKPQKQTVLVQDENQLLENGLRTLLQEIVSAAVQNGKSVMQYGPVEGPDDDGNGLLTRLLDIVLYLCEKGNVEGGMIFQLLEDLTEVSTIRDCKEVFGYIEGKQETLGKSELFSRGKLVMLRTCNQLLRRLSKTNDVVFCGRILMFLAHFFPLSERSAVNIKGVFNTSNETKYEKESPGDGVAIGFTFYKTFWSLQEYFFSPTTLTHNNPSKWQTFSSNLGAVLEAFEVQPLGEEDEILSPDGDDDDSSFNIKYLTSSNLMSLELKDPGFRRHVLVQCLIIFDYLKSPGKAEKDGPREVIREELKVHEDCVKKLLRITPPKGREFLASIDHILQRDKNWVLWKRDGCAPFERSVQEKKPSSEPARRKPRWRLGNRELHRLWKSSEDNPNAITDPKRAKMSSLTEYFKPLAEDMDPEAGIEEEYHHKSNKVYCWKGLRFSARQDLEALSRYSDMKIMGVVPPELLTPEVRSSLYKTSDRPKAKGVKKGEDQSLAQVIYLALFRILISCSSRLLSRILASSSSI